MVSQELTGWVGQRCMDVKAEYATELRIVDLDGDDGFQARSVPFDEAIRVQWVEETMDGTDADADADADGADAAGMAKGDRTDWLAAACCGMLSGMLDSFLGRIDLDRADQWGKKQVHRFVLQATRLDPEFKGTTLCDAIVFLEDKAPFTGDQCTHEFGGGHKHHLRDFSHHCSPTGLAFSLVTQFTGRVYGIDAQGEFTYVHVPDQERIGKTLEEKLFRGIVTWFLHMASDMDGSRATPGAGKGVPGPVMSLLQVLAATPMFKDTTVDGDDVADWLWKLFDGKVLTGRDGTRIRFDLRQEIGLAREAACQALPVLVNECLVRSCYMLRRLAAQLRVRQVRSLEGLRTLDWQAIVPSSAPVVCRMVTIATGTFTAIDLADAAMRAWLAAGGKGFQVREFVLRVNYPGLVRLAFAIRADLRAHRKQDEEAMPAGTSRAFGDDEDMLGFFTLDQHRANVLASIEHAAVQDDIEHTSTPVDRASKERWLDQWRGQVGQGFEIMQGARLTEAVDTICVHTGEQWTELVALEASQFRPYVREGKGKTPGFDVSFLDGVCNRLPGFAKDRCSFYRKAVRSQERVINGTNRRILIGAGATVALAAATAGAGVVLAPVIAPVLAGSTVAGLSGAALTSASLAALGGGALAAGGMGMAGGVAVIAGGGALLGMLAGGATAVGSVMALTQDAYVLQASAKLVVYCKQALLGEDRNAVVRVQQHVAAQLASACDMLTFMRSLERSAKRERDKDNAKALSKIVSTMANSVNYITACDTQLRKMLGIDTGGQAPKGEIGK